MDPLADAFQYSNSSLDKSSIASMVRRHQRAEEVGQQSVMSAATTLPGNKAQEFLSNKLRPVWEDFKVEAPVVHNKKPTLAESKIFSALRTLFYHYMCILHVTA